MEPTLNGAGIKLMRQHQRHKKKNVTVNLIYKGQRIIDQ